MTTSRRQRRSVFDPALAAGGYRIRPYRFENARTLCMTSSWCTSCFPQRLLSFFSLQSPSQSALRAASSPKGGASSSATSLHSSLPFGHCFVLFRGLLLFPQSLTTLRKPISRHTTYPPYGGYCCLGGSLGPPPDLFSAFGLTCHLDDMRVKVAEGVWSACREDPPTEGLPRRLSLRGKRRSDGDMQKASHQRGFRIVEVNDDERGGIAPPTRFFFVFDTLARKATCAVQRAGRRSAPRAPDIQQYPPYGGYCCP